MVITIFVDFRSNEHNYYLDLLLNDDVIYKDEFYL